MLTRGAMGAAMAELEGQPGSGNILHAAGAVGVGLAAVQVAGSLHRRRKTLPGEHYLNLNQ